MFGLGWVAAADVIVEFNRVELSKSASSGASSGKVRAEEMEKGLDLRSGVDNQDGRTS